HGVHGCGERTGRARGHAGDRDLTGGADDPTGGRDVEDLRLREVAGKATVVVDEVREGQRVDVGEVVGRDDASALGGDVLAAGPVAPGGRQQRGLDDRDRDP